MEADLNGVLGRIEAGMTHLAERIDGLQASITRLEGANTARLTDHGKLESEIARLDERIVGLGRDMGEVKREHSALSERTTRVEQRIWTFAGGAATVATLATLAVEFLLKAH
jgi:chromosome segregation ATPase